VEPTVILIGGASRVGKTTVAARVGRTLGCGWTSLDVIRGIVASLVSELAEACGPGIPPDREAELFFPHFEHAAGGVFYLHGTHVLEGVGFMPKDVPRLGAWINRTAVFLGARSFDLELGQATAGRNGWLNDLSEAERSIVTSWIESWSREVESQCHAVGLPYFDISDGYDIAMDAVIGIAAEAASRDA
jgi:hypothetical protein